LSPEYQRPDLLRPIPAAYKEEDGWKTSTPGDALDRGSWWTMFEDPVLDDLMGQLNAANQNIAVAAANLRQARARVMGARSAFLPTAGAAGSTTRGSTASGGVAASSSIGISAQWEISFWNAIPAYEAVKAQAAATAADYATMRLAMQAELAQAYFQLRILDVQHDLYESTIAAYAKAVQLTRSQYMGGVVTPADVAQAEAQLASAEAQIADLDRQRALLEHGIAILVGQIPSSFTLERGQLAAALPGVPLSAPSTLLERRPDVAAAERMAASANEEIGLARAAWFPTLTLGADRALQGGAAWLASPLTVWSLGPSAALSLFQGGKRIADSDAAQAKYEAAAASYRQTVLQAFKDVEDNLAALRFLEKEAEAQSRAVASSQMALRLSLSQYRGGMTTYLQVVSSQTAALTAERSAISVQGQRLITAVSLIKALGGGWDAAALNALSQGAPPQEGVIAR
jgi:NodT family efflux transporter outer membrane factor (OMF) lipoprotein